MSEPRLFSLRNRWFITSVGLTLVIAVVAALAGLVWLPLAQPDLKLGGIWDAICSAAGLVQPTPGGGQVIQPDYPPPASRSCRRC